MAAQLCNFTAVTFGHDYTPVNKYKENQTTTAAAAWTPSTSTKVVITDFYVTNGTAPAGTWQIRFGNVGGQILAGGSMLASSSFGFGFATPMYSSTYDRAVFFETGTSQSSGGWNITLSGFEQE